jgi:hypothetical protein
MLKRDGAQQTPEGFLASASLARRTADWQSAISLKLANDYRESAAHSFGVLDALQDSCSMRARCAGKMTITERG